MVEKTPKDAISIIEKRINGLKENQHTLITMSDQIQEQMKEISKKAQEIYEQSSDK